MWKQMLDNKELTDRIKEVSHAESFTMDIAHCVSLGNDAGVLEKIKEFFDDEYWNDVAYDIRINDVKE